MQPTQSPAVSRSDLIIRPAQASDRVALETIAAQIWDGDDYLPHVLDDWFNDPHGGFYVATLHDNVVGVVKLTQFAPGEWWMEGLRVDPAYQGHGFGRILHHFVINQVRQRGHGEVRFSTGSMNEAVQQLARETGFERKAIFLPYGADVLHEPVRALAHLAVDDLPRVRAFLDKSTFFARAQGSLEWDWSYYCITDDRLRGRLQDALVYGWSRESGTLDGLLIANSTEKDRWPGDPTLKIAYLDAPDADLPDMARDIRRLAAQLGRVRVRIKALAAPEHIAALEAGGFVREWDGEVWLYARDVVLTEHAEVRVEDLSALN